MRFDPTVVLRLRRVPLEGASVRDDPAVAELLEIAASTASVAERAQALVERLERWLPVEATWLALSDPESDDYATVGSTGLQQSVLDYLDRPAVAQEIQLTELDKNQPPFSVTELSVPVDELPAWAECLIPAGFSEGLGLALFEPGDPYLGMLGLLFSGGEPPSAALRDRLEQLATPIARAVSPLRSLLATARLVHGAASGAVLFRRGSVFPLPGLEDHGLLVAGSPVVEIARRGLLAGDVYRSFLWPGRDGPGPVDHVRATVLAATGVPALVLGTLLIAPEVDCRGLTPRELQVLGLLVDGRSNQQIARSLAVAPRTVAAHVEHLLDKLHAPTRTSAAVWAERAGCYVPPPPDAPSASHL